MAAPKSGSLADLGLQRFMDDHYYKYGGYPKLISMFERGDGNAEVAMEFSPPDRPKKRQAVRPWRARWELEKQHPELKNGGVLEEATA